MAVTRQNRDVFLIGLRELEPLANLKQLPTIRQVLQRFHEHLYIIKSVRNASHVTIDELLIVWCKAAIPAVQKTHAIEKLEKIHSIWLFIDCNIINKGLLHTMEALSIQPGSVSFNSNTFSLMSLFAAVQPFIACYDS
jgi:hypothetical protein